MELPRSNWLRSGMLAIGLLLSGFSATFAAEAVTTGSVNLRAGPGTGYTRIATLPSGTIVDVATCGSGWCRVTVGRLTGWVFQSHLSGQSDSAPIYVEPPVVEEQPPIYLEPPVYRPSYRPRGWRRPPNWHKPPGWRPPPDWYRPPGWKPPLSEERRPPSVRPPRPEPPSQPRFERLPQPRLERPTQPRFERPAPRPNCTVGGRCE